jgi:CheY-like chemotaxis protein
MSAFDLRKQPLAQSAHSTPHILVVDDDPDMRRLSAASLSLSGFSVTTASDGIEALDAQPGRFDAITTDLSMPRMDGYEFVQRLHDLPEVKPVVAVTARTASDAASRTVWSCHVMSKPCDLHQLAANLRWLLRVCGHSRSACATCPCSPRWAVTSLEQ